MNCIKLFFILFLSLAIFPSYAQDKKPDMSNPIEFTGPGWNKVLCMKNGNTLLFHFDPTKPVVVNVFDSTHKRIATQEYLCSVMDINALRTSIFKGIFDINGEAVLFIEQEHFSKFGLVRMRFNGSNGQLIEEKLLTESKSQSKRTRFFVMKNKEADEYAVFYCTDNPLFKECSLNVTYYNKLHEPVKEVPLEVANRKQYDAVEVVGAEWQPVGICITLDLKTEQMNATFHGHSVDARNTVAVTGHDVCFFFVPKNGNVAKSKVIDVTTDVYPYYSNFTYNEFAKSLNVLLLSYREYFYKFGIDVQPGSQKASLFFNLDEDNMSLKYKWIKNEEASTYFREQADSTKLFEGLPIKMFTNQNGLSTVIYESYTQYKELNTRDRSLFYDSYLGNLCITQFDDDGNELWGTVLPDAQYSKSSNHFYFADELSAKWQQQIMFGDLPGEVTNRQFLSVNAYCKDQNFYLVFNDVQKNFNNSMKYPGDTVSDFNSTNACYYKMDRKRGITKNYLLGEPSGNEYKCSFIEGADFDEKRGVYATLVQCKTNESFSLRMAWKRLD